jgi:hypothetical protein
MNRKINVKPQNLTYGVHRLVNKKTGRLSSNTNWLIDLAAIAFAQGQTTGIGALLPLNKARKLLLHNKFEPFRRHKTHPSTKDASSHAEQRGLAQQALPAIVVYYTTKVMKVKNPSYVTRKKFVAWIVKSMSDPESGLNLYLHNLNEYTALAETKRGKRWWLDQIKMQSKKSEAQH